MFQDSISLYVHWPFCKSKCPYCDFNSHVRESINFSDWTKAYLKELEYVGNKTKGRKLKSVFFGGGTPSLMQPETVNCIIESLSKYWQLDENLEITLEGNPNSIEIIKYQLFAQAGINRVSIGIQSLSNESLKFLGRGHNAKEALHALHVVQNLFDKYSFDLMYALPGQNINSWLEELSTALKLAKGHISLYQLTIEPNTKFFYQHQRGDFKIPNADQAAKLFEKTNELLKKSDLYPYEISNYAVKGQECIHNLVYWKYLDYACIGPGAHGRVQLNGSKHAIKNFKTPEKWLEQVNAQGHSQEICAPLSLSEMITEHLLMGLRLYEGINKKDFLNRYKVGIDEIVDKKTIDMLVQIGYVVSDSKKLQVTCTGMLCLNSIVSQIISAIDEKYLKI